MVTPPVFHVPLAAPVTYDWNTLTLRQSGSDTAFINALYKVHYIQ